MLFIGKQYEKTSPRCYYTPSVTSTTEGRSWGAVKVYSGEKKRDKLLSVFPEWESWGEFFIIAVWNLPLRAEGCR